MAEVFRINTVAALAIPSVYDFVREALSTNALIIDVAAAMAELAACITNRDLGLFVAQDGKQWSALAMLQRSFSAFNPACVVIHFYSRGDSACRNAILVRVADFAREGGFSRIIGVDTNDRPDAFMRLFRGVGTPVKAGSMVVFDTGESMV